MPVSTLIVVVMIFLVLIGVIFHTAYDLGRAKEKIDYEQQKAKGMEQARKLRSRLACPSVVERLHDRFKR